MRLLLAFFSLIIETINHLFSFFFKCKFLQTETMNLSDNATSTSTVNWTYCALGEFSNNYRDLHGYLSLLVCIFGSVTNVLNICVLTTREMRWPTNFILTGLAVADLLVMLDYIPFACHFFLDPLSRRTTTYFSYGWAVYTIFHAIFTQIFHFISCCLTVILAIWRYVAITHSQNNKLWSIVSNGKRTIFAILLTYILCPIICIPLILSLRIIKHDKPSYFNNTIIKKELLDNYTGPSKNNTIYLIEPDGDYQNLSLLVYGVVIKLVPCVLLTILSKQLICALLETKRRRRELLNSCGMPLVDSNGKKSVKVQRHMEKEQQTDRTTRMLLAVLLLFLITEFPQGILGLLSILIGDPFWKQCYIPFGNYITTFIFISCFIFFVIVKNNWYFRASNENCTNYERYVTARMLANVGFPKFK